MILNHKQTKAIDFLRDAVTFFVLYGGAAGGGKSYLGCYWLFYNCVTKPGSRWFMGRKRLKDLRETTLLTFFEMARFENATHLYRYVDNPVAQIKFHNGSVIFLKALAYKPSDPDCNELGSTEYTGGFIDEIAEVHQKVVDVLYNSRIRYGLERFGFKSGGKILGTCNPSKEWVYTRFYEPHKNGTMPEGLEFVPARVTDNKRNLAESYINRLRNMPDGVMKQRLYYGNWEYEDADNALYLHLSVISIFSNGFVPKGKKCITADIARLGRDSSVILVWEGYRIVYFEQIAKNKINEISARIREVSWQYEIPMYNVIVDEGGVGGGVVDELNCRGFFGGSTSLVGEEMFLNNRCFVAYKFADLISQGRVFWAIPISDELKSKVSRELGAIRKKYQYSLDSKKRVTSKEEQKNMLGHSPDIADALMMRTAIDDSKECYYISFDERRHVKRDVVAMKDAGHYITVKLDSGGFLNALISAVNGIDVVHLHSVKGQSTTSLSSKIAYEVDLKRSYRLVFTYNTSNSLKRRSFYQRKGYFEGLLRDLGVLFASEVVHMPSRKQLIAKKISEEKYQKGDVVVNELCKSLVRDKLKLSYAENGEKSRKESINLGNISDCEDALFVYLYL